MNKITEKEYLSFSNEEKLKIQNLIWQLSPEELTCDGELSKRSIDKRYKEIQKEFKVIQKDMKKLFWIDDPNDIFNKNYNEFENMVYDNWVYD